MLPEVRYLLSRGKSVSPPHNGEEDVFIMQIFLDRLETLTDI